MTPDVLETLRKANPVPGDATTPDAEQMLAWVKTAEAPPADELPARRRLSWLGPAVSLAAAAAIVLIVIFAAAAHKASHQLPASSGRTGGPPCKAAQLSFSPGIRRLGHGDYAQTFVLRNAGRLACTIDGYLPTQLGGVQGSAVLTITRHASGDVWVSHRPRPVRLRTGASASFAVAGPDHSCPSASSISINAPDGGPLTLIDTVDQGFSWPQLPACADGLVVTAVGPGTDSTAPTPATSKSTHARPLEVPALAAFGTGDHPDATGAPHYVFEVLHLGTDSFSGSVFYDRADGTVDRLFVFSAVILRGTHFTLRTSTGTTHTGRLDPKLGIVLDNCQRYLKRPLPPGATRCVFG